MTNNEIAEKMALSIAGGDKTVTARRIEWSAADYEKFNKMRIEKYKRDRESFHKNNASSEEVDK